MKYNVYVYLDNELIDTYVVSSYVSAKAIEYQSMCKFNGLCQVFIYKFNR